MIGAVVLATDQGLGYLAKAFYDNGIIDRVLIKQHSTRETHEEWYDGSDWKYMSPAHYDWFFAGMDTLLLFETPFDWKIIVEARNRGVKTAFIPMYECTQYPFPYTPDLIIAPSALELSLYKNNNPIFLPIPVDFSWKQRTRAEVFVHNAGNGGLGGRNGTKELLEAMRYVKSPVKLIIRSQERVYESSDPRVVFEVGTIPGAELYATGDVFIFPEKFNGLSLPLQEAYASGMLVMATNRYPMNTWLPHEPLIEPSGYKKERIAIEFDCAIVDQKEIAKKIDEWYGKDITRYSQMGKTWGETNSWANLKDKYLTILYGV